MGVQAERLRTPLLPGRGHLRRQLHRCPRTLAGLQPVVLGRGPQADAILTMQLQRLTGLEIKKLAKEYADLAEQIEGYEAILASEETLLDIIREDIQK